MTRALRFLLSFAVLCSLLASGTLRLSATSAQDASNAFLSYVKQRAAADRQDDQSPATVEAWQSERLKLRESLEKAWGGFPAEHAPLEPRIIDTLQRDGYRIEKLVFQTFENVWMTANAYVPEGAGKRPAVLCVHGHWRGAKQDPHVQARCIGLAKLGFFALAVDALGAGERGLNKALGEYHGEMVAATLLPTGKPLSGLQVYENMRAVDYLQTRAEVDPQRIGITGASGGGNQTMYAGAWDERFRAVVPVCSVGNYQAYLGAACCMCEVVPGALSFTEEGRVLGLIAPRALMVINATKDAFQFSVNEASKSVAIAKPIFGLYQRVDYLRHEVFESPHDYNEEMREAMYGWMARHLKNEGDGSPIDEPMIRTEDPEVLRCFPDDSRPDDWTTLPQLAARFARQQVIQEWSSEQINSNPAISRIETARAMLNENVLGDTQPFSLPDPLSRPSGPGIRTFVFNSDPGIQLTMQVITAGSAPHRNITLILTMGDETEEDLNQLRSNAGDNDMIAILSLRATGKASWKSDKIGRAPDHNTAEWSLWIGQPLLGQWTKDARTAVTVLREQTGNESRVTVLGNGPAGIVALCSGAIDDRINRVVTTRSLGSFITEIPYENQRLGTLANGILRDVGDIQHLASLIAPRQLTIIQPVNGQGRALDAAEAADAFLFARSIWKEANADDRLIISADQ
ncbi:MAG: acetylxylan esterase [Planctomycetaceae bacterium]|nr:acetylxylan esterase [Planctomycetaceae bacterium]